MTCSGPMLRTLSVRTPDRMRETSSKEAQAAFDWCAVSGATCTDDRGAAVAATHGMKWWRRPRNEGHWLREEKRIAVVSFTDMAEFQSRTSKLMV